MNKKVISCCFLGVVILVLMMGICYQLSYQITKNRFDHQLSRQMEDLELEKEQLRADKPLKTQEDGVLTEGEQGTENGQDTVGIVAAEAQATTTIHAQTQYTLEIYDREKDHLSEYELNPPAYLIGLDREGLIAYMKEYMENVPLDEFQMGLISYECVSFSPDKVVLRKVYDQSTVPYQYYLVVERGYLVVYYADQKTVYEYTGIEAKNLPEEEQVKLAYGIFLKDQGELYGLLQGYSS